MIDARSCFWYCMLIRRISIVKAVDFITTTICIYLTVYKAFRDRRLEVRRIRSEASRDRPRDVVWLDFMAPHRHLGVDVTVTSARKNANVPRIGARLPIPGSLVFGAQHGKLDVDLRTSALLGTPMSTIHSH
jgi:hypothetical protein